MHTQTPRADVCTSYYLDTGEANPNPFYPAQPEPGTVTRAEYWTIAVQRSEAKLAALKAHWVSIWRSDEESALSGAFAASVRLLEDELEKKKGILDDVIAAEARKKVPA